MQCVVSLWRALGGDMYGLCAGWHRENYKSETRLDFLGHTSVYLSHTH